MVQLWNPQLGDFPPQFSAQSASQQAGRSQEQAVLTAVIVYSTVDVVHVPREL